MSTRSIALAPGTWGELVQGVVDGNHALVTCPVNLHACAVASAGQPGRWQGPSGRPRTQAALDDIPGGGRVSIRSPLRPGAGMASSTADLCAAMAAASALAGLTLTPEQLFTRCLQQEPTDGLMFPGIALVDHVRGSRVELLGPPPPLGIVGVDPGGVVQTAGFNSRADLIDANRRKEPAVREALAIARGAVAAGDGAALAAAATLSARAHQAILPNPLWERAEKLAPVCGALGINVAHSGTVIGFLFDLNRTDLAEAAHWLRQRLGLPVRVLKLIGGGVSVNTRR
ncbi:MAG TPA: GHMP kinase [Symbiobacteriaceae bacterium]|nr:GHMP kinase [Symbiobacteriaceae bacterium]